MTTTLSHPTTTTNPAPRAARPRASIGRLVWTELRLVLREPVVLTFVFAFPVITVLVLGGVFDDNDPAFEGVLPSDYYAAGYMAVVIAAIGLIMIPVHLAGYRERGVTRRFQVSAFPGWALPLTHVVIGLAMTAIGIAVLLAAAWATYGLPEMHDLRGTAAGVLLGSLAFTGIGVAIGSLVGSARAAQGIGMMLFFPLFLLGGGGPPPDAMGPAMQTISSWLPLTHVMRAAQEPWLDLGTPTDHLVVLAGILVASTGVWAWASSRL